MSDIGQFLNIPGLRGLNKDERERIAYFLESPGRGEFFFLIQMLGKTPAQVRNTMIEEFMAHPIFAGISAVDGIVIR